MSFRELLGPVRGYYFFTYMTSKEISPERININDVGEISEEIKKKFKEMNPEEVERELNKLRREQNVPNGRPELGNEKQPEKRVWDN